MTPGALVDQAARSDPGVTVSMDGAVMVLTVEGCLDAGAAAALADAATAALDGVAVRLDVDLRGVVAFTPEGAAALAGCAQLACALEQGLRYRTGRGAGREALHAAYLRPV